MRAWDLFFVTMALGDGDKVAKKNLNVSLFVQW
jgi:hypothetical protein